MMLHMYILNIKALQLVVSDKKILSCVPLYTKTTADLSLFKFNISDQTLIKLK